MVSWNGSPRIDPEVLKKQASYHWSDKTPKASCAGCRKDKGDHVKAKSTVGTHYQPVETPDQSYARKVPIKYGGIYEGGDSAMVKLIKDYAIEGGKKEGKPNGQFYFDVAGARDAAR